MIDKEILEDVLREGVAATPYDDLEKAAATIITTIWNATDGLNNASRLYVVATACGAVLGGHIGTMVDLDRDQTTHDNMLSVILQFVLTALEGAEAEVRAQNHDNHYSPR